MAVHIILQEGRYYEQICLQCNLCVDSCGIIFFIRKNFQK